MALPDSKAVLRSWLRGNAPIFTVIDNRTYFAMPEQDRPQAPFTVHYRVGGLVDDMWQDYPDFIIECWGNNQKEADDLARLIAGQMLTLENGRHPIVDGVRICGAQVNSMVPIDGTKWAKRTRLDTTFHMRLV